MSYMYCNNCPQPDFQYDVNHVPFVRYTPMQQRTGALRYLKPTTCCDRDPPYKEWRYPYNFGQSYCRKTKEGFMHPDHPMMCEDRDLPPPVTRYPYNFGQSYITKEPYGTTLTNQMEATQHQVEMEHALEQQQAMAQGIVRRRRRRRR